jgi:predicted ATPase/transcriptional regulator with XRE-family HTH domain
LDDNAAFGAWLKQQRRALDITQEQLADRIGCSKVTITKIEAGERRPSRQMADLLAKHLHIPSDARTAFTKLAREGLAPPDPATQQTRPLTNLPTPLTPIVGREQALVSLCARLRNDDVRLLTLTGAPGIGKTRLALQLGATLLDSFADGVFFVPLAAIREPGMIIHAIAEVLGLSEVGSKPVSLALADALGDKKMLLILDNFEQVVEAGAIVADLLRACPRLQALVTSREALNVRGEHQFAVPPLALPDPAQLTSQSPAFHFGSDNLAQYPAIKLFVDRARAVRDDFVLNDENAPTVAAICAHVDGLPLAIELVAARLQLLPPWALLARLRSRLDLQTSGPRDLPARQRTLKAAIGWSYDLLTPQDQKLFAALGVFEGGVALSDLEGSPGALTFDFGLPNSLNTLGSLVTKSLVQQTGDEDAQPRFSMLATIREYALDRLRAQEGEQAMRRRHADHYLAVAQAAAPYLAGGDDQQAWLSRLEREHDNFRAAIRWTLGADEPEMAGLLTAALLRFWWTRGHLSEGRAWAEQALRSPKLSPSTRAKIAHGAGTLAWSQGDYTAARTLYEEGLSISRELGDKKAVVLALNNLGLIASDQGDHPTARGLYEEGLAISRELDDKQSLGLLLNNLGNEVWFEGDLARARTLYEESVALDRELGDRRGIALGLINVGMLATEQGDYAQAQACHEEGLAIGRELGDKFCISRALSSLAVVALKQGDHTGAAALTRESLAIGHELGDKRGIAERLEELAGALCKRDQVDSAYVARLLGTADALREAIGAPPTPTEHSEYERTLSVIRTRLGDAALDEALQEGRAMPLDEAIASALG